jgi:hypothetical protein
MMKGTYKFWIVLAGASLMSLMGCGGSSNNTTTTPPPPTIAIAMTSGSSQSAQVGAAFAPLVATVTSNGSPASGMSVTFTAPTSGATGTFAGAKSTETDTTNAQGVATSSTFTANTTIGAYTVTASTSGASKSASFNLSNTVGAAAKITATAGGSQSAIVRTAFGTALSATVVDVGNNPVNGAIVTFTAPASSASGIFTDSVTSTTTATTNANGVATAASFTANSTVGGPYTVTATVSGVTNSATFSLTNSPVPSKLYSFYLSGLEASNTSVSTTPFYALAGSVQIDSSGAVIAGEQDYNDANGFASPQPQGDQITGGTLTVGSTGQGTLTLQTSNTNLGVSGVETLGVQFVNASHALVIQFDGSATSSGSMDVQDLSSAPNGAYSFVLSGADNTPAAVSAGGVFTVSGTALSNGVVDLNDSGGVTSGTTWSGTLTAPDAFGRGTITGTGLPSLNYYVVGPEVMRLIDVDSADSAVGSAYGQGTTTFTNASLGTSVAAIESNSTGFLYAVLGQYATTPGSGTFQGVEDSEEGGTGNTVFSVTGNYSISNTVSSVTYNGYGSATFLTGGSNVIALGIYMVDPTLNINDPNNPTGGGGALVLDLDSGLAGGVGVMIPQTDTSAASFDGNYVVGGQGFNGNANNWEFDFLSQGSVSSLSLNTVGMFSDPGNFLTNSTTTDTGVFFAGTLTADGTNPGRYTLPLTITPSGGTGIPFQTVVYQASGAQLYWLDEDNGQLWLGPVVQQGSLNGMPALKKPVGIRRK